MDEERFYDTHPDLKAQLTFISLMIPGGSRGAYKFIEYGVDVDTRWGSYKRTALHTAALENDPQAIVQLLKWGGDQKPRGYLEQGFGAGQKLERRDRRLGGQTYNMNYLTA